MSDPNQPPPANTPPPHDEIVQYSDGQMALEFSSPGNFVDIGPESKQDYAQFVGSPGQDIVLIRTRSGNVYGFGDGMVVNNNRQSVYELPTTTFRATVGEPLTIPGVGHTTEVEKVLLQYKSHAGAYEGARQEKMGNPFVAIKHNLSRARQEMGG